MNERNFNQAPKIPKKPVRKFTPIREILKRVGKQLAITGALAGALYGPITEKYKQVEKKPARVELKLPKPDLAPKTFETRKEYTKENIIKEIGTRKFELLGIPKNLEEEKFLEFIFRVIPNSEIDEYQKNAEKPSKINPDEIIEADKDIFYLVWDMYREGKTGVRLSEGLLDNIKNLDREIKELEFSLKKKSTDKIAVLNKLDTIKDEMSKLRDKKNLEEIAGKKENDAERLAIAFSVLCRAESPFFPAGIAVNVLKEAAYSWTLQEKYPMYEEKPDLKAKPEKISFNALYDNYKLVVEYIKGKSVFESKTKIREKLADFLNLPIHEIIDTTMYNTENFMPKENGEFSKAAKKATSSETKSRLKDDSEAIRKGKIKSFKIGSHIFHNRSQAE